MARVGWDQYFMNIATVVATRATCNRKHVGALIVKDKRILATGYNGSIRGTEHCGDDNHIMEDGHCVRVLHAESNALSQAAMYGVSIKDAMLYVTALPCWPCYKLISNAGIQEIVYGEPYRAADHISRIFDHAVITQTLIRPRDVHVAEGMPITRAFLEQINVLP